MTNSSISLTLKCYASSALAPTIWQQGGNNSSSHNILSALRSGMPQGLRPWGRHTHCWWEGKLVQPLWKPVWRSLKKLRLGLPYDPALPLLGIDLKILTTFIHQDICTPMFRAVLFMVVETWEQLKSPSREDWIEKMCPIHTMEYHSATTR